MIISQALKDVMEPEQLISIRQGLELSQKDMAFKLDISSRQLRNLESGKCLISKRMSQKAANIQVDGRGNPAEGDATLSNPPKFPLQTRMKSSFTDPENASPRPSGAQLEKITFCQDCGGPFRISEPVNKKVKPLIPREGTIPGPCPICFANPLTVSQEHRAMIGIQAGQQCSHECFADCRYQLGLRLVPLEHSRKAKRHRVTPPKCSVGLIPIVNPGSSLEVASG